MPPLAIAPLAGMMGNTTVQQNQARAVIAKILGKSINVIKVRQYPCVDRAGCLLVRLAAVGSDQPAGFRGTAGRQQAGKQVSRIMCPGCPHSTHVGR